MMRTVRAVSSLIFLMILFLLTFAILGLNLFGGTAMEDLDSKDSFQNEIFSIGSNVRYMEPGQSLVQTATFLDYDHSSSRPFKIQPWSSSEIVWAVSRTNVEVPDVPTVSKDLKVSTIIGLVPRSNFDTFWMSCLTTLQIMTLSQWKHIWFSCIRSTNTTYTIYFFAVILVGNYILYNLFAAIIIQGFAEKRQELDLELKEQEMALNPDTSGAQVVKLKVESELKYSQTFIDALLAQVKSMKLKVDEWLEQMSLSLMKRLKMSQAERSTRLKDFLSGGDGLVFGYYPSVVFATAILDNVMIVFFDPSFVDGQSAKVGFNIMITLTCMVFVSDLFARSLRMQITLTSGNFLESTILILHGIDVINVWSGHAITSNQSKILFLRMLRPIKIILTSHRLCDLLNAIAISAKPLFNTMLILLFSLFICGILAVQLFSGKMEFCSDPLVLSKNNCTGIDPRTRSDRSWQTRSLNYDWIGNAMLTLFVVATMDDWSQLMWYAVDASVNRGQGPIFNNHPEYIPFFIFLLLVFAFLLLNIFAGVVVDTYKTHVNKSNLWSGQVQSPSNGVFVPPLSVERYTVFQFVSTLNFELFMFTIISLDVSLMMVMTYRASPVQNQIFVTTNYIFTCIYGSEALCKLFAFFPSRYFESRTNKFEFLIVVLSYIGIALELQGTLLHVSPSFVRMLRLVRIVRVLRAYRLLNVKAVKGLRNMIETLVKSLPYVLDVCAMLMVIYFIFGMLMVGLFKDMCTQELNMVRESESLLAGRVHRCLLVDERALLETDMLRNTAPALLILLRLNTADSWGSLMQQLSLQPAARPSAQPAAAARALLQQFLRTGDAGYLKEARKELPGCQTESELKELADILACGNACPNTCGRPVLAPILCVIFVYITLFLLMNLILAILMQNLQEGNASRKITKRRGRNSMSLLMNVSKAAAHWRNSMHHRSKHE
eukprot:755907-Hanusia_phi.AAC.2